MSIVILYLASRIDLGLFRVHATNYCSSGCWNCLATLRRGKRDFHVTFTHRTSPTIQSKCHQRMQLNEADMPTIGPHHCFHPSICLHPRLGLLRRGILFACLFPGPWLICYWGWREVRQHLAFDLCGISLQIIQDVALFTWFGICLCAVRTGCYEDRKMETRHVVLMGGHSAWQAFFGEKRIDAAVVIIGCPDFQSKFELKEARRIKLTI